ncbi:hypothetical protein PybrP1_007408 [[Pythium] brassicae (nom. inval.)]|nr:hypothetical protein PybrP1_007408 [[Pythium] brassicae (nom. inval.)]
MGGKKPAVVNTKVEAANARKAVVKGAKDAKAAAAAAAAESAEWAKGSNARGESRKADEERKKQEAEERKAELKRLQALEESALDKVADRAAQRKFKTKEAKELNRPWEEALKPAVKKNNRGFAAPAAAPAAAAVPAAGGKLTQAQMRAAREAEEAEYAKKQSKKGIQFATPALHENRNRDVGVDVDARSIESALDALTVGDKDPEKHPERRAKAAYKAFEEEALPQLKQDFPGLKLSQYKQRLSEMWRRSPQNPLNQESLAYNAKKQ